MALIYCRECGKKISDSSDICVHCGAPVKNGNQKDEFENNGNTKKVNWTLTLIMSIFFGCIGVDRFIMGHVGLGILKLLTFGGFSIWWLIDLILIGTKFKFKNIEWF
jgi:TM2 domain-containing membrane protein YozV